MTQPVILVTNDDGINARGVYALMEAIKGLGKVLAVIPADAQSGMSHAITVKHPLRITHLESEENFDLYKCYGTPVDCVKLGFTCLLDKKPDIIVSGINHGCNSSTSILYSGTMAAALEGALNGIPSIGFSLLDYSPYADFIGATQVARNVTKQVLEEGLPYGVTLNVNIPAVKPHELNGIKVCRQTKGHWIEEFDKRKDPSGKDYYWLTGKFNNLEPDAKDTDEWALKNNYVSIVPVQVDLTCYNTLEKIKHWEKKISNGNGEN